MKPSLLVMAVLGNGEQGEEREPGCPTMFSLRVKPSLSLPLLSQMHPWEFSSEIMLGRMGNRDPLVL